MYKLYKYFLIAAVLVSGSCVSELGTVRQEGGQKVEGSFVLDVSISQPTKTALGTPTASAYPTVWNEGDVISVNGIVSYPVPAESTGESKASFSFDGFPMLPLNLLYPATEKTDVVDFPLTQYYVKDSFDPRAAVMYATSAGFEDVSLSHLSSLLRFSFTSAENVAVKCILVKSDSKEPLAGSFAMETNEKGEFTGGITAVSGSPSMIVLDCGDGVGLSQTATAFYVAVPYGTYSGFSIQVITTDGNIMALNYTPSNAGVLNPSKVVVFPAKAFVSDGVAKLIGNEADLLSFAESAADYSTVILMDDIEVKSSELAPIKDFAGTFEGGDNTISGLKAPLFDNLKGNVSNLHVQGDLVETTETNVGLLARTSNGGNITGCSASGNVAFVGISDMEQVTVGGLVGEALLGTVTSCTTDVNVTVSATSSQNMYVGGMFGTSSAELSGLKNLGKVTIEQNVTASKSLIVGGLSGRAYASANDVRNSGQVSVNASSPLVYASSLMGAVVLKDKKLSGLATADAASLEIALRPLNKRIDCFAGGLIGYFNVSDSELSNSENNALVTVTVPEETEMKLYGGGCVGYSYYEMTDSDISVAYNSLVNNASVKVSGLLAFGESNTDRNQVGGIVGRAYVKGTGASSSISFTNCANNGNVDIINATGSKRIYAAGIVGEIMASDIKSSGCVNTGNITASGTFEYVTLSGHIGLVWRPAATSFTVETAHNSGSLTLNEATTPSYPCFAGGVIGMANGPGVTLTMKVKDCVNSGNIHRSVPNLQETDVIKDKHFAFAGGIIGSVGHTHKVAKDDYVEAVVENCSNSGQIIFNMFPGEKTFLEKFNYLSFTGGIIGLSRAMNGHVDVKYCSNSGSLLSTSGTHGGIVGFAQASTSIFGTQDNYCMNTGTLGMRDVNNINEKSSAYLSMGGICGYMKGEGDAEGESRIEYCWNEGVVAGSAAKAPGAGGIVAWITLYDAVYHCKNSGWVRSLSSVNMSGNANAAGLITGSDSKYTVRDCAAGGCIGKNNSKWFVIVDTQVNGDSEREINKMVYGDSKEISDDVLNAAGIRFWDGSSKTSWEK